MSLEEMLKKGMLWDVPPENGTRRITYYDFIHRLKEAIWKPGQTLDPNWKELGASATVSGLIITVNVKISSHTPPNVYRDPFNRLGGQEMHEVKCRFTLGTSDPKGPSSIGEMSMLASGTRSVDVPAQVLNLMTSESAVAKIEDCFSQLVYTMANGLKSDIRYITKEDCDKTEDGRRDNGTERIILSGYDAPSGMRTDASNSTLDSLVDFFKENRS